MDNIVVKFGTNEDIYNIIEFEKEVRLTEAEVLYWNIDDKEYKMYYAKSCKLRKGRKRYLKKLKVY
ncbi:hypothetical protein QJR30_07990 [Paraclostridium sordellii]|uniref:hypothetical protein n=1 Tax=Paraclostridium sordellii TaxID=1505 RepID=UPI0005E6BE2B|nr:hypothetical protein [Paeniclostridium sordellii]CEP80408.1 Uncharacterised protein [[Clostridium] sordellii] [Paeniclostridium sordellii]